MGRISDAFARLLRRAPEPEKPEIGPMTIREAIEAMKIVAPHVGGLYLEDGGLAILETLWSRLGKDAPANVVRLLALLEHTTVEAILDEYQASRSGVNFVVRMGEGFVRNPLDLLVNAAYQFGLTEKGWRHG